MKKTVKKVLKIVLCVVLAVVLLAGGYVSYVLLSYNRIGDKPLEVKGSATENAVSLGTTYKALSYNIGFGVYSQDYTFFMDTGYDEDGNETCGYYSTARSKDEVLFNVNGAINAAYSQNADFIMFQEVDTNSTRSCRVNEHKKIVEKFSGYDFVHAVNFHTAFLPYPLYDMHGTVNSGLTTLSKYKILSAERKEYTVSTSFSKYFDLDRCFSVHEIEIDGSDKKLYIVNSHMSAYDEGGTVRKTQIAEMKSFLDEKARAGHYVVVGGDWNHDLLTYNPEYSYDETTRPYGEKKRSPEWVSYLFDTNKKPLIEGYKVVASDNVPSCRNNDIEYEEGKTFVCTVDGFIITNNIQVVSHETIKTGKGKKGVDGFAFSDHEPTVMEFKLN
ncbi:MAG: endonuclease [Clostridia bacterium]|nr:endonuclease [Clostridia bacterium]